MKRKYIKQSVAFVVFLISAAAMDSQLYIQYGLLAIGSAFYLLVSARKEQNEIRRGRRVKNNSPKTLASRDY